MFIGKRHIRSAVYGYIEVVIIPLNSVHVKTVRAIHYRGSCRFSVADDPIIFFTMDRAMDNSLVKPHMLHDINFAVIGPFEWICISQHPDGGPGAPASW